MQDNISLEAFVAIWSQNGKGLSKALPWGWNGGYSAVSEDI